MACSDLLYANTDLDTGDAGVKGLNKLEKLPAPEKF